MSIRVRALRVLQSFQQPRPTTNPYVVQLAEHLRSVDGVIVMNWSWPTALLRRYDVFHVHWPEILVDGHAPLKKLVRQLLYLVFLVRLKLTRTPIVRTVHNLALPEGISRREVLLLRLTERWTTLRIAINATTPREPGQHWVTILHGHYRDWFEENTPMAPIPGRIGYFGLIRRYKSVDTLVRVFEQLPKDSEYTLRIAGKPSNSDLAQQLTEITKGDNRVQFEFEFLDDEALVKQVTQSELIVLPYREMHNSGAALTALSLDRPVLVPDNEANRALAAEVGPGWLYTFGDPLDCHRIEETFRDLRSGVRSVRPNLSEREWEPIAFAHLAAYEQALGAARQ